MSTCSASPTSRGTIRLHVDTEFTDFIKTDLISIGVAADNQQDFYGENLDFNRKLSSEFVKNNIYPMLNPVKHGMKRTELSARLWSWIDELPCEHVIVTVDYPTDYSLLHQLFDNQTHPKMLKAENIFNLFASWAYKTVSAVGFNEYEYAGMRARLTQVFFQAYTEYFENNPSEIRHHSLADARANRYGYNRLVREFGLPL